MDLVRTVFYQLEAFPGALVQFNDWALYQPDQMALVQSMRRNHGENRPLIEAPGHLFDASEQAEAIGHCYLALMFRWSAYLYLASGTVTILFWEGDLIDVWSPDTALTESIRKVVENFELKFT